MRESTTIRIGEGGAGRATTGPETAASSTMTATTTSRLLRTAFPFEVTEWQPNPTTGTILYESRGGLRVGAFLPITYSGRECMRILLVDDSLTIRSLLRRTLRDVVIAEIDEAANGLEALALLGRQRFQLVILDVNMPLMDGLEVLEAIRASPEHAGLPVVMLTSEKNEALVRRLVELGITAFLSKPLGQEAMGERLAKILDRLREPAPAPRPTGRRLLIVEQDQDRRHFRVNTLAGHYELIEADSGASALHAVLADPAPVVDLVLVGQQVGLPPVEMLVSRLRALPNVAGARMIGCVEKGATIPATQRRLFDAVLVSSAVPDVFLADLEHALTGAPPPLTRLLLVRPTLARDIVAATELVFGMMLSCEVDAGPPEGPRARPWSEPAVFASIGLVSTGDAPLSLLFRADRASAQAIAARLIGVAAGEAQDADVLASAAELSNIVLGRLRNRLIEAGLQATIQIPRTWIGEADDEARQAHDDPNSIDVAFRAPALGASFEFLLFTPSAVADM